MKTPRTDEAEILYGDCTHAHCQDESHLSGDFADFARQLETELAAITALADQMAETLKRIFECQDAPDIDIGGESQFGLHCGVEDRGCYDRYEGADYGYSQGVERALEWSSNEAFAALAAYENQKQKTP